MIESLSEAKDELKRVDHLIYVSLKYTRTVDVLLNAISRMVDAYDYMFTAMLKYEKDKGKIQEIPGTPIERGNTLKRLYPDDLQVNDNVAQFFLFRKLTRTQNPKKEQEYRRHVTMKTIVDGKEEVLDIDSITGYYHFMLEFFKRIETLIIGNKE